MLDVSKLEFETLLMSKELANNILADPTGFFVAVKTSCCKKVIPYRVSKNLVREAQVGSVRTKEIRFPHCNKKTNAENAATKNEYYCKRCKVITEDRASTTCSFCNLMEGLTPLEPLDNPSENTVNDIELTHMHVKGLLLYAEGYRIIKDPVSVTEEHASPYSRRSETPSTYSKVATLYPGVYDPDSVVELSNKKVKERIKIIRGLNPGFKPL